MKALGKMRFGDEHLEELVKLFGDRVANIQVAALQTIGTMGVRGQMYASSVCRLIFDNVIPVRLASIKVDTDCHSASPASFLQVSRLVCLVLCTLCVLLCASVSTDQAENSSVFAAFTHRGSRMRQCDST